MVETKKISYEIGIAKFYLLDDTYFNTGAATSLESGGFSITEGMGVSLFNAMWVW
jgi:hypothetical protein